jgi:hypothetical protein
LLVSPYPAGFREVGASTPLARVLLNRGRIHVPEEGPMRRLALIAALALAACAEDEKPLAPEPTETIGQSLAALRPAESCDALLVSLRANGLQQMNEHLDRNLAAALQGNWCYFYAEEDGATNGGPVPGTTSGGSSSGASQYSTTNNQVAGVDEADFLKNDSRYLYVLADGQLQVIEAWPPEQAHVIGRFAIEGRPLKMFVNADRAVVYSSLPGSTLQEGQDPGFMSWGAGYEQPECTYGYSCDFTGDGHPLKITVLDLTVRSNPTLVREMRLSGSFINARRIGDAVHTVVGFPDILFPGVSYWPDDQPWCDWSNDQTPVDEASTIARFERLRAHNRELIEAAQITDWLPGITDVRYVGGQRIEESGLLSDCNTFYESQLPDGRSFLSLVSFDPSHLGPLAVTTVVGRAGAVYASSEALYVATRHQQNGEGWLYDSGSGIDEATTVHKFLLTQHATSSYAGSGVVKGRVLNQFSMDEHAGYFRIATSTGYLPSPDVHSTVTVLQPSNGALVEVGRLDHLAPAEDIRSARFEGDRGFIVTFKKTDPLFVLDLADPRNPQVVGELQIPGFSTYMHMMDDRHLLAIGYDAEDHGDYAFFQGVQLQIFDIGNPAYPALDHKTVIGTRGTSSEALTNHLAFNYFAPMNLLAIPMAICEGGEGGGNFGDLLTFSGLMVYDVTADRGFSYRGGIAHEAPETEDTYRNACGNWWSEASTQVKRSVIMDDYVFSVAEDLIKVANLNALGTDVASIPLVTAP